MVGQFFRPPGNDRIWFYSERGLLAYLFHAILEGDLSLVLDNAMDGSGRNLREVLGPVGLHQVLTEFSLGNKGFGNPDGAILTGIGLPNASFVFVEGKPVTFQETFQKPEPPDAIQASWRDARCGLQRRDESVARWATPRTRELPELRGSDAGRGPDLPPYATRRERGK